MTTDRTVPVTVLESFPAPRRTTNPYLARLPAELPDDVRAETFSWRTALVGRYDVFHVHWPEKLMRASTRPRTLVKQLAAAALLARLALTRTPVVRTLHNTDPHEPGGRVERLLLRAVDRRTATWIMLTPDTARPAAARPGSTAVTIPHPHYRDWYAGAARTAPRPGRLLYFGLVRPYKGVEDLLAAFADVDDDALTLHVVGSPESPALRDAIAAQAATDPRVGLRLEYADDDVLAAEVGAAQVVVLPYRRLQNSGAALLALSLDRPVLVPAGATATRLAAETGPGWVTTFEGTLTPADLTRALDAAATLDLGTARPDLSTRDWPGVAAAHADVFRACARRAPRPTPAGAAR